MKLLGRWGRNTPSVDFLHCGHQSWTLVQLLILAAVNAPTWAWWLWTWLPHWNWSPRCLTVALHGLTLGRIDTATQWLSLAFSVGCSCTPGFLSASAGLFLNCSPRSRSSRRRTTTSQLEWGHEGRILRDQCCTGSPHQAGILRGSQSRTLCIRVGFFWINEGKL